MIMRQYLPDGKFDRLVCCHAIGSDLQCDKDMPSDTDVLIGLFPDRHATLMKCCNTQNLIDMTEEDK